MEIWSLFRPQFCSRIWLLAAVRPVDYKSSMHTPERLTVWRSSSYNGWGYELTKSSRRCPGFLWKRNRRVWLAAVLKIAAIEKCVQSWTVRNTGKDLHYLYGIINYVPHGIYSANAKLCNCAHVICVLFNSFNINKYRRIFLYPIFWNTLQTNPTAKMHHLQRHNSNKRWEAHLWSASISSTLAYNTDNQSKSRVPSSSTILSCSTQIRHLTLQNVDIIEALYYTALVHKC